MSSHFYVCICLIRITHGRTLYSSAKCFNPEKWDKSIGTTSVDAEGGKRERCSTSWGVYVFFNSEMKVRTALHLLTVWARVTVVMQLVSLSKGPARSHFYSVLLDIHFGCTILSHNQAENTNTNVCIILLNKTKLAHVNKCLPECHSS